MLGKKRERKSSNCSSIKSKSKLQKKPEKKSRTNSVNSKTFTNQVEKTKLVSDLNKTDISSVGISKEIEQKLIERGITSLFEVQQKVFTPVYNGDNTIVASLTGSGKTLSFILPLLERYKQKEKFNHKDPTIIVLAPTRELAIQIANEFKTLSCEYKFVDKSRKENNYIKKDNKDIDNNKIKIVNNFSFKVAAIYGGDSIDNQKYLLKNGVDIVVGTPGRVIDMIERGDLKLNNIRSGVLDEADKMLEMGFQESIIQIFDKIYEVRNKLQVCLFSATMHKWVADTAKTIMRNKDHTFVNLVANLKGRIPPGVENLAVNCLRSEKITTIADLIICYGGKNKSTIVFVPTKKECNNLMVSEKLKTEVQIIHGDINQKQREASIEAFKAGKVNVLVATDVAARGLDIPMVDLVIQSEPPKEIDSYIHRAGRTARAGRTGTCITLFTKLTEGLLTLIENKAKIKFKRIGAPQRQDIINASIRDIKNQLHNIHETSLDNFKKDANDLLKEYDSVEIVSRLLAHLAGQTGEIKSRSVICGAEGFVTFQLDTDIEFNSASFAWSCLKKVLPFSITEKIKGLRTFKNMKGAIFDIEESDLKEVELSILSYKNPYANFNIKKCLELPELTTSDQRGGYSNFGSNNNNNRSYNSFNNSNFRKNVDFRNRKDIFVGNMPYNSKENDLKSLISSNGIDVNNIDVRIVLDKETGNSKGIAFISVYDEEKYNSILSMKNKSIGGKYLRIDNANKR